MGKVLQGVDENSSFSHSIPSQDSPDPDHKPSDSYYLSRACCFGQLFLQLRDVLLRFLDLFEQAGSRSTVVVFLQELKGFDHKRNHRHQGSLAAFLKTRFGNQG